MATKPPFFSLHLNCPYDGIEKNLSASVADSITVSKLYNITADGSTLE